MIERLDHLNIRTSQLDEMIAWYGRILDLHPGERPDFSFPGAWLYGNGQPLVHLVQVDPEPSSDQDNLKLEHGAFSAKGFDKLVALLDESGERKQIIKVPGMPIVQINVWDPDQNHLHIDFDAAECGDHGRE